MKLQDFSIDIYKLGNGLHEYQYAIDDSFFALFEYSTIDRGRMNAAVSLDKQVGLITARFVVDGTVALVCDRSLEEFDQAVRVEETILYQYGEEEEELTEEIMLITERTQQINVAQPIYEFVALAVPMKRLHPRYADEEELPVEGEIVFSSQPDDSQPVEETNADPRWDALKKLKNQ